MRSAPSLAQHPLQSTPEGCEGGRRREPMQITNVQEIFDWQVTDWSRRITSEPNCQVARILLKINEWNSLQRTGLSRKLHQVIDKTLSVAVLERKITHNNLIAEGNIYL